LAILTFAVDVNLNGVNLDTVGVILMVVGGIGLLLTLLPVGASGVSGSSGEDPAAESPAASSNLVMPLTPVARWVADGPGRTASGSCYPRSLS
jgi:hypothetical protein